MAKIKLPLVQSGYNLQRVNHALKKIEDNINYHSIQRSEGNNVLNQDLDMDSNLILNVKTDMESPNSLVNVSDLLALLSETSCQLGGYEFVGDYKEGIKLTKYNQVVRTKDEAGNDFFWRVSGKVSLPYTLTGEGVSEGGKLVSVGEALLRDEVKLRWNHGKLDPEGFYLNSVHGDRDDMEGLPKAWFNPRNHLSKELYSSSKDKLRLIPRMGNVFLDLVDMSNSRSALVRVRRSGRDRIRLPLTGIRSAVSGSIKDLSMFRVGLDSVFGGDSFEYVGGDTTSVTASGSISFLMPISSRVREIIDQGVICSFTITPSTVGKFELASSPMSLGFTILGEDSKTRKVPKNLLHTPSALVDEVEEILDRDYLDITIPLGGELTFEPNRNYFCHLIFRTLDGEPASIHSYDFSAIISKAYLTFPMDMTERFYEMYKESNNGYYL